MIKEDPLEFPRENRFAFWRLRPVGEPIGAEGAVWGGKNEALLVVLNFEDLQGFDSGPPEQFEITRFRGQFVL